MRNILTNFFDPTNTVFAGLLVVLVLTVAGGAAFYEGPALARERTESWDEVVVLRDGADRRATSERASGARGFIPISEASPTARYREAGRDTGSRLERVTLGNLPPWSVQVIPALLLLLSLWPLLAAFNGKRWALGCVYIAAMGAVCWHAFDVTWRYFPDQLLDVTHWNLSPVGFWAAFLLLALMPREGRGP
jgi:hypothetical protein